jgi:hypothetical protein
MENKIVSKIQSGLKWWWNKVNSNHPKEFFIGGVVTIAALIIIANIIGWIL